MQGEHVEARYVQIVKAKLRSYGDLQRRIDHQVTRLENLMDTIDSLPAASYSGMLKGSSDGTTKAERYVERKDDLERRIDRMIQEERELRRSVESMIALLTDPDEQAILEMKYIDGLAWPNVCLSLFGELDDYAEGEDRYMKRTFRIHGEALQRLAAHYRDQILASEA